MKTLSAIAAILATAIATPSSAGIFSKPKSPLANPAYQATYLQPEEVKPPANGAIFRASAGYSALTNGGRASAVGDILTILLTENTNASKTNGANTNRTGSIALVPPVTGVYSKLFNPTDVASSGSQGFKGAGEATQSNALSGEITVTVAKVMGNGMLLVRGQKALTLNRGDEYIQISGLVRPADIGPDNRVLSTRVADARITYTGRGEIARASRQGWLQSLFSMISPF
jgi:flagellar L-ring protein precursor FlgH